MQVRDDPKNAEQKKDSEENVSSQKAIWWALED